MKSVKPLFHVMVAVAGVTVWGAASADTCTGRVNQVAISSESIELSKGYTMTSFVTNSIATSEDSANNAIGKCTGYALTTPDGVTRMAGACARKTRNGDGWSDTWELAPGADRGTWKLVGGTGVFAGKHWTGWWRVDHSSGPATMVSWGGNCD
ncbi:MAG: hypothetical protein GC151_16510 [Betaproteobacteria bacterium]|nr:hypothetical protein [Betaproteobacteria bacterium]